MENLRNRISVKLVNNEKDIFDNNLVTKKQNYVNT